MSETDNKTKLQQARDNLPHLILKIIIGMPDSFSTDEKELLKFTNQLIQAEIERRNKSGRKKKWASMQEKNAFYNAKRRNKTNQKNKHDVCDTPPSAVK